MSDNWLTSDRLSAYPRLLVVLYIVTIFLMLVTADGAFDYFGRVLGTDFVSYYSAAQLVLKGQASVVYDLAAHFEAEKLAVGPMLDKYYGFFYPPTFLLILAPLGTLPYVPAFLVWQGATFAFFVLMVVKLAGRREAIMLTLAFPAVLIGFTHGQNAFLTAGLLIGALNYLDRKPIVAGVLIGLLSFKPHLGVLIPFVIILSGRWRVFFSAAVTTLVFATASWIVVGTDTWVAFIENFRTPATVLTQGVVAFHKMQTLFSALRSMGLEPTSAYLFHSLLAISAALAVLWVWHKKVDVRLHYAALGTGTLLVSPFMLDYDLAILAVPIVCMATYGQQFGYRAGLLTVLCAAWIAPLFVRSFNYVLPLPWTPTLLSLLLYHILRETADQINRSK